MRGQWRRGGASRRGWELSAISRMRSSRCSGTPGAREREEEARLAPKLTPLRAYTATQSLTMSSLQSRKDEIAAKRAKLAELKRQRELRAKEVSSNRQSIGDASEVRRVPPSATFP